MNIVWLTLESFRYDRTSMSGYSKDTTPGLQAIANDQDAKSFDKCFTHGIWSRTSAASMLTGTYPSLHQVLDSNDIIPDELPSVPELLSEHGYHTIGFGSNCHLDTLCSSREMFDEYVPDMLRKNLHKPAGVRNLLKFLLQLNRHSGGYTPSIDHLNIGYLLTKGIKKRIQSASKPVFVYSHYQDPHNPSIPPIPYQKEYTSDLSVSTEEAIEIVLDMTKNSISHVANGCSFSDREWAAINALYDGSLAYTDEQIKSVVDYIRSELDDTVVIITGDHGELFGERGQLAHRVVAHDAVSHVPLIISGPTEITDYDGHIQHIDVVKTILNEVGIDHDLFQGFDLRNETRRYSVTQRGGDKAEKTLDRIVQQNPSYDRDFFHEGLLTVIRSDEFKYEQSSTKERLYKMPDETRDVISEYPEIAEQHHSYLQEFHEYIDSYPDVTNKNQEPSDDVKKRLEDMGYLVE